MQLSIDDLIYFQTCSHFNLKYYACRQAYTVHSMISQHKTMKVFQILNLNVISPSSLSRL